MQCIAAGAMWERIVEKGPRPCVLGLVLARCWRPATWLAGRRGGARIDTEADGWGEDVERVRPWRALCTRT